MHRQPILDAFATLLRHAPAAPVVVSRERSASRQEVEALAARVGDLLGPPLDPIIDPIVDPQGEGALVALAAPNGPLFLAALLALWRRGAAALLLDAQAPAAESLRIARALGASSLLRAAGGWPHGGMNGGMNGGADGGDWSLTATAAPESRRLPGIAVVKLTSGSTGTPRGITASATALWADDAALAASMGITADDRLLAAIPLSHSYGLSSLALPALTRGSLLVLSDGEGPLAPLAAAEAHGATVFPTVPAYVEGLLRLSHRPNWPRSLRLVVTAGAPLSPATAFGFRTAFGLPIHVFYGASECGGICYDREGGAAERGTVGTPVEGVAVTLEPPEGLAVVTVSSPAVACGYLPDPDPRLAGGRFRAGDLAVWQGGELALRGRVDDLINVKGKKVDPREVESVLAQLAGVDEVAVLGVPQPERGSEVVRAVVACRDRRLTAAEILAWCRGHLSAHKVPRSVVLVLELPRTARGKLDRAALRELPGSSL